RLLDERRGVAIEPRVRLDRQPPLQGALALEHRLQQLSPPDGDLLEERPRDLVLAPGRVVSDQRRYPVAPEVHLLRQDLPDDRRVRRRADGPVLDRVRELLDGAGVVPVVRRGRRDHLVQRALEACGCLRCHRDPLRTGYIPQASRIVPWETTALRSRARAGSHACTRTTLPPTSAGFGRSRWRTRRRGSQRRSLPTSAATRSTTGASCSRATMSRPSFSVRPRPSTPSRSSPR